MFLHSCTYGTGTGDYAADCGTLVVPENRLDRSTRLIALPVTRIHAQAPQRRAPIFYLQGGPGITNMKFPQAARFNSHHDVVLVGYRGIDGSVRLDCHEVTSALTGVDDLLSKKTLHAYSAAFRDCANRLTKNGVDLAGYNLVERVDDMEAARKALGYRRVDLISESVGTRTAMIYAWRHPHSIARSVMLGVNPPGHFVYDGATTDGQIQHYAHLCTHDAACRARTADLAATMRALSRNPPKRWLFLPIKAGNVRLATFYGLMHATSVATPLSSPETIDSWVSAAAGDPSGMWFLSLMGQLTVPNAYVWGDEAATGQIDDPIAAAYYAAGGDHGSILRNGMTDSLWGGGGVVAAWPHSSEVDRYRAPRASAVDTLLIGGDVDFATPAQFATKEFLPTLRHGHQVILHNVGHTDDTWNYDKPALNRLVNGFFDTGRIDTTGFTPRLMNFDASPSQTLIAKIILTSLSGLVLITVLMLVWLQLRLRKRGSVGRKTALATRAVYAPFIGVGGWCLGLLVLLSAWPAVSIASAPVTVLSVGAPVGLAVYLAWVHREWRSWSRTTGLSAALGGAAVGAWLGLHAISGLFSAMTAVAGAVLAANLALLVRDIVWGKPSAYPDYRDARGAITRVRAESTADPAGDAPAGEVVASA